MFDAHANFAISAVTVAPSPALSGTSLTVTTGTGALFPAVPFNCTVYPSTSAPISTNAEIVRVTNVTGDVLTIVRAQEGSTAKSIAVGYSIANTITKLVFTDIENAMVQGISAAGGSASGGTILFSNSPTVSFGRAGQTITASAAGGGGGGAAISAGTQSQSTGTVIFSNSNGATFGLNAGTLTLSYTVPGATVFSNANNITFGLAGSTITASASNAQSTQPVAASASNGSFLFSTLGFSNANGVTFGTSAGSIISASVSAQSVQPVNASAPNGSFNFSTLIFSNSNNVSWSTTAGNGIVASVTVASTQGSIQISGGTTNTLASAFNFVAGSNVSISMVGNAMTLDVPPPTFVLGGTYINVWGASNVNFDDANGVSWGLAGRTITASVATSLTNIRVSAGTTSNNASAFTFANANNVSFGLDAGTVTASASSPAETPFGVSAGTQSVSTGTLVFSNSNGVTFGMSNSSRVTASFQRPAFQALNGTATFSTLAFVDNVNISWNTTAGPAIWGTAFVNFSGGTTSNNASLLVFSNSNGVSFGLNGSTITASVAESNNVNLLGANTAGNTTASGSTLGFSGINLTISGTNNSQIVFSAPATSSLVGTGGITISTAGFTISISQLPINQYEQFFPVGTNSTTFVQPVGQWWMQPIEIPAPISGGHLNVFTQFGSTSQLPLGTTSASWGSNTSGQKAMRYQYSCSAALWSLGVGGNSTRMESFWSNQNSFEISHNVSISGNVASMTVSMGVTLSGISNIDSAGGVTTTTYGGSSTISSSVSTINSTANSSILSSVNNMLSNSVMLPIPFNTTINPGIYYLGIAYSTASSTTGSSQVGFSNVNVVGQIVQANIVSYRMFGKTTSTNASAYFPGFGSFSVVSAAPPATMAFSDVRALATNAKHYFNWVNSNAITI